MIYKNLHGKGGSKKVLSLFLNVMDNGQQLPIKDIVVAFGG